MKNILSTSEFIALLEKICEDMESAGEKLGELDAACGDGDLGMNVKLGFKAVRENLPVSGSGVTDQSRGWIFEDGTRLRPRATTGKQSSSRSVRPGVPGRAWAGRPSPSTDAALLPEDIGAILIKSGLVFGKAGASTFGALLSTAFIRAGGKVKGLNEIGLNNIFEMVKAAGEGIMERGKACPGERTMLDAMIPAQEAIARSRLENKTLKEALEAAATAAEKGADLTAGMKARHGRAGWLAERSKNIPDAGAKAIAFLFRAAAKHVQAEG